MTRYDKRLRALAISLSTLAGFIDGIGFIASGGFFVSFMSGNSTRLGVGAATATAEFAIATGLIAAFIAGVMTGALIGHRSGARRKEAVLFTVAALVAIAAAASAAGALPVALAVLAIAMGAENAVFEQEGEVRVGLTYMTGSLVKVGQGLAGMLLGRHGWDWTAYLLLWGGFVVGAIAGAASYASAGLSVLWGAAAASLLLALVAARLGDET